MAPCFWLRADYMISIKDLCVFPCCHNNAVQRGIIAAPPAQANQIYCLRAHHKTKVKNIDLILMHVSFQGRTAQKRALAGACTIALAQCFKPIKYEIKQRKNEPWQVLALLPWLNNGSKQVHVMFLTICSNSRV